MILQITIPDALYNKYQSLHQTKTEDEVKSLLKVRLLTWLDQLCLLPPESRSFIVGDKDRQALEAIFDITIDDAKDLVKRTQNLSKVKLGPVEFNLTADEIIRLEDQAKFHGWSGEDYIRATCQDIKDQFMGTF